ncbi:MAG: hypothetical protein IIA82_03720 [Thaumarchaeota archaeon]|nr:hypothetical protein [Nitrososphaerota archaeon]
MLYITQKLHVNDPHFRTPLGEFFLVKTFQLISSKMDSKKPETTRRERRPKLDIYFAILNAIQQEETDEGVKPTRIQYASGMSYDKVARHLKVLQEKKLIIKKEYYHLTEKGHKFLAEYSLVKDFVDRMDL